VVEYRESKNSRCLYEDFPEMTIVPVPSLGVEHIIANTLESQGIVSPVSVR